MTNEPDIPIESKGKGILEGPSQPGLSIVKEEQEELDPDSDLIPRKKKDIPAIFGQETQSYYVSLPDEEAEVGI